MSDLLSPDVGNFLEHFGIFDQKKDATEFLAHYGVKGQKWGRRKARPHGQGRSHFRRNLAIGVGGVAAVTGAALLARHLTGELGRAKAISELAQGRNVLVKKQGKTFVAQTLHKNKFLKQRQARQFAAGTLQLLRAR